MTYSRISVVTYVCMFLFTAAVCGVYLSTPATAEATKAAPVSVTVVATSLRNPRGLNFSPDGALYVAEAGGNGTPTAQCGVMGDGAAKCYATTGSITRIDLGTGVATRVLTDLPSLIAANGNGTGASGVHDISLLGLGNAYVTVGFGANPALRAAYFGTQGNSFARLGRFTPGDKFQLNEDLGYYEQTENPDKNAADTNPYGILVLPGKVIYADAGGNTLNQVTASGEITTLAVFPNRFVTLPSGGMVSIQAVPTSVVLGPDGDLYVGQLTGGPFQIGAANVYRVPIGGGTPVVAYSGFTNIIDIAFAKDGLYVLEIARNAIPNFNPGRLVHIALDGTRTEIAAGQLVAPGGIAIARNGTLYVTNRSTSSTIGEVLRIDP